MPKTIAQILAEAASKVWDAAKQAGAAKSQSEPYEGQGRAGSRSMQMERDQRFASYVKQKASGSSVRRSGDDWMAGRSQAERDWLSSHPGALSGDGGSQAQPTVAPVSDKLDWSRASDIGLTNNERALRSSMRDLYSTRPGETHDPKNFDNGPAIDPEIRQMASNPTETLDYRIVTPDLIHHLSKQDSTLGQNLARKYLDTPLDLNEDGYRNMFDLAYPSGFHTSDGKTLGADEFRDYNTAIRQPKLVKPIGDIFGLIPNTAKFVTTELGYARQQQRVQGIDKSIDPTSLNLDTLYKTDPETIDFTKLPPYYRAQVDPNYATQRYVTERYQTDPYRNVWGERRVLQTDELKPETDLDKDTLYRSVVNRIKSNSEFLHRAAEAYTPSMWINEVLSLPSRAAESISAGLEGRSINEKAARTNLTGTGYENSTLTGDELVNRIRTMEAMVGQPLDSNVIQELPRGLNKDVQDQFIEAARAKGINPGAEYFKDGLSWNDLSRTLTTLGVPSAKQEEIATSLGYTVVNKKMVDEHVGGNPVAPVSKRYSTFEVSDGDRRVTYDQVKSAGISFMDASGEAVESAAVPDVLFENALRTDLSRSRTNGFLDFVGDVLGDVTNYGPFTLVWKPFEFVMEGAGALAKASLKAVGATADIGVKIGGTAVRTAVNIFSKDAIKQIPEHAVTDTVKQLFTETVNSSALKFARRVFVTTASVLRPEDMHGDGLMEFVNTRLPNIAEAARNGDIERLLLDEKVPATVAQNVADSFRSAEKFLADLSSNTEKDSAEQLATAAIVRRAKASIKGASEETKNELEKIVKNALETGHYDDFVDAAYYIEKELRRQADDAGNEAASSVVERAARLMNEGQIVYGNAKLGVHAIQATERAGNWNKVAGDVWGAWTNAVLTLRPGWQVVNYIDNTFRMLTNGDLIDMGGKRGGFYLSSSNAEDILRTRYGLQRAEIADAIKRYYGGSTEENILHYLSGEGSFFDPLHVSAMDALRSYSKATRENGIKGLGSELWKTLKSVQPRVEGGAAIKVYARAYISAFDEAFAKISKEIPDGLLPSPEELLHRFDNVTWMDDSQKLLATQGLLNQRAVIQRDMQSLTKSMLADPNKFSDLKSVVQSTIGDRAQAMRSFVDAHIPAEMPEGELRDGLRDFIASYSTGVDFTNDQSRNNLLRLANDYIDAKLGVEHVTQTASRATVAPPPMSEFAEREMINSKAVEPDKVVARAEKMAEASRQAEPAITDFAPEYKPRTPEEFQRDIVRARGEASDFLDTKNSAYTNALEDKFTKTNKKVLGYEPSRTDTMRSLLSKRIENSTSDKERQMFTDRLLAFEEWSAKVRTSKTRPIPSGVASWQEAGLNLPYRDYIRQLEQAVGPVTDLTWKSEAEVRKYLNREFTARPNLLKSGLPANDLEALERYAQMRLQLLRMVDEGTPVNVMRAGEESYTKRALTMNDLTNPKTRVEFSYTFNGTKIPYDSKRAFDRKMSTLQYVDDSYTQSGRTIFRMTHGTWVPVVDVNATGENLVKLVPHDVMAQAQHTPALNRVSDEVENLIDTMTTHANLSQSMSPELDSLAAVIADGENPPLDMQDYVDFVSPSGAIGGADIPEVVTKKLADLNIAPVAKLDADSLKQQLFDVIQQNELPITDQEAEDLYQYIVMTANGADIPEVVTEKLTDLNIAPVAKLDADSLKQQLFGVIQQNKLPITDQEAEDLYQFMVMTANANDLSSGLELGTTLGRVSGVTGGRWSGEAVFQKQNLDTPEFRKFFDGSKVTVSNGVSADGMSRYKQLTGQWQNEDGTLYFVPNGSDERLRAGIRKSGDKYYVEGITRIDREFDSLDDAKSAVLKENADLSGSIDNPNQPMVMYHGTPRAGFEAFDPSKLDPDGLYGPGIYMTDSPRTASGVFTESGPDFGNGPAGYVGFERVYSQEPIGEETAKSIIKEMDDSIADTRAVIARGEQPAYDLDEQIKQRNAFNLSISKDSNSEDLNNLAVQFSDSPKQTGFDITLKSFAESSEQTGAAYPLYASIKNPFDIDVEFSSRDDYLRAISDLSSRVSKVDPTVGSKIPYRDPSNIEFNSMNGNALYYRLVSASGSKESANRILRDSGYDGITHVGGARTGNEPHRVFIAFDPGQVKSAIANRGTWDKTSPSMLLQQSGDFVLGFNQHIFDPSDIESARSLIGLLKGSNADTAFEEWSHHLFKMQAGERKAVMYGWAKAPVDEVTGEYLSHYDVARELKELSDTPLMTATQTERQKWLRSVEGQARKADEDLTLAFRKYVMTGVAPNSKLKEVFESVKRILTRTWQSIKAFAGVKITPELRASFDDMLGADPSFMAEEMERLTKANTYILGMLPSDLSDLHSLAADTVQTPEYIRARLNAATRKMDDIATRYGGGEGILTGEYDESTQQFALALQQRSDQLKALLDYADQNKLHPAKAYAEADVMSARGLKPRLESDIQKATQLQSEIDKLVAIKDANYDFGRKMILDKSVTSGAEIGGERVEAPLLSAVQRGDIPMIVDLYRQYPEDEATQYAAFMTLMLNRDGVNRITGEPANFPEYLKQLDELLADPEVGLKSDMPQKMLANLNASIKSVGGLKSLKDPANWDKLVIEGSRSKAEAVSELENQLSRLIDKYSARTGEQAGAEMSLDVLKNRLAEVSKIAESGKSLREVVDGLQRDLAKYTGAGSRQYPTVQAVDEAIVNELARVSGRLPAGILAQDTNPAQAYKDQLAVWFDAMRDSAKQANPVASSLGLMSPDQQKQTIQWLADVGSQVSRAAQTSKEIAAQRVNEVLMDYDTTLGLDAFLTRGPVIQSGGLAGLEPMRIVGGFVPFAKFPRMNAMYMAEQLKRRPQMVRWYQRWQENINAERRSQGLPEQSMAAVPVTVGDTQVEISPLSVLSAKSAIGAVTSYIPDYFNPTERFLANAKNLGFSVSPGLNLALRASGVIRSESMSYFSLIPQGQLLGVVPGLQANVSENQSELAALLGIISPGDARGVVKQLGYNALSEINRAPENLKKEIAGEYVKALESQSGPKWDTAMSTYYEAQAPGKTIGYFTGLYPRQKSEQEAEWQAYRNDLSTLRETLSGLNVLDDDTLMRLNRMISAKPEAIAQTIVNSATPRDDAGNAILPTIKNVMQSIDRLATQYQYDESRAKILKDYFLTHQVKVGLSQFDADWDTVQAKLAQLDADYAGKLDEYSFSPVGKKPAEVQAHLVANFLQLLENSKPTYAGDYDQWKKSVDTWERNLPTIGRGLWDKFSPVVGLLGGEQAMPAYLTEAATPEALKKFEARFYTLDRALGEVWSKNYYDGYWQAVNGKVGKERLLAEREYANQHPVPTDKELYTWLQQDIFGGRFAISDVRARVKELGGVASIKDKLMQGKDIKSIQGDTLSDLLARIPPGRAWYKFVDSLPADIQKHFNTYIDNSYTPLENDTKWSALYEAVSSAIEGQYSDPSTALVREWVQAENLNKRLETDRERKWPGISDLVKTYGPLSTEERSQFRAEHPEIRLYYDWLYNQFAKDNPLWAKYYSSTDAASSSGRAIAQSGYYGSRGTSRGRGGGGRSYSSPYSYRGSASQPYYENAEQRAQWIEFRNTAGDVLWGDLTNYWDNGGQLNSAASGLLQRLYSQYAFGAKNYEDWLNNILPNLRSAMIPGHDIFKDFNYFSQQYQPNVRYSNNQYWFSNTRK